jgi:hypothetical protein
LNGSEARLISHFAIVLESGRIAAGFAEQDWPGTLAPTYAWHNKEEYFGRKTTRILSKDELAKIEVDRVTKLWSLLRENEIAGLRTIQAVASQALHFVASDATTLFHGPGLLPAETARIHSTLRYNTAPQLLLSLRKTHPKLWERVLPLLLFLSRHRMPKDSRTVWEATDKAPELSKKDPAGGGAPSAAADLDIVALLELVSQARPLAPESLLAPSVLLGIASELAEALLNDEHRHLLESGLYRKVLWQSLDAVVWHETIRGLYANVMPEYAFLPVDIPPGPDKYLWLIAEYGYVVLGIDRDLRVHAHFRRAEHHEALLYHAATDYRDHLFHAIHTFLLGVGLLEAEGSPLPFSAVFGATLDDAARKKRLRDWFLAALFHDFGHVIEMIPAVLRIAEDFATDGVDRIVGALETQWEQAVAELHRQLQGEWPLASRLDDKRPDHGVFSYLHLRTELRRLDPVARDAGGAAGPPANSPSEHCRQHADALVAVLKHSLLREPIAVDEAPLAALLVLCDEIQEWQRPCYNVWELAQNSFAFLSYPHDQEIGPRRVCEAVLVKGCSMAGRHLQFTSPNPTVILRYGDQNRNLFEPLTRLLHKVYNLERIHGLNRVPLVLEIWIPRLPRRPPGVSATERWIGELDILRDFCLLKEIGIGPRLYTVTGTAAEPGKKCSCYEARHLTRVYDAVSLNLRMFLDDPRSEPLVKKPPWEFEEKLLTFKREYCRVNHLECTIFNEDEDWPERQIFDVSSSTSADEENENRRR